MFSQEEKDELNSSLALPLPLWSRLWYVHQNTGMRFSALHVVVITVTRNCNPIVVIITCACVSLLVWVKTSFTWCNVLNCIVPFTITIASHRWARCHLPCEEACSRPWLYSSPYPWQKHALPLFYWRNSSNSSWVSYYFLLVIQSINSSTRCISVSSWKIMLLHLHS